MGVYLLLKQSNTSRSVSASRAHAEPLPLFAWANSRQGNPQSLTLPRAARVVALRFGLPPSHARVVAELAGYVMEATYA